MRDGGHGRTVTGRGPGGFRHATAPRSAQSPDPRREAVAARRFGRMTEAASGAGSYGRAMSATGTSLTTTEQVERANASGLAPVVFIHGLWLLPSSWDRWAVVFEDAGYTALTPGWPDDPETVEEAKEHPEVFADK